MANVDIDQVRKTFGGLTVLHEVSVSIRDTEFAVLVGPSGCGKSTLLRMIAGLEEISAGDIRIGGRTVNGLSPSERDIAMVFQSYALYPHKTVRQNITFPLKVRGEPKAVIEKRVGEAAEMLGLTPYLDRYPKHLSGGQRQRVAMGRALVRDPQVFLFDEPLSNLDAKLRVQMRSEIRQLHQRLGATSIYVTHDQIEAMTMATTIIAMNSGRIEQIGSPKELYETPRNKFVATFIGSPTMNLVDGVITRENGAAIASVNGARLALGTDVEAGEGAACDVGVRPEHFVLADKGIPGQIRALEYTGNEMHVFVQAEKAELCVLVRGAFQLTVGEQVHLACEPQNIHLFDKSSGLRLHQGRGQ